MRAGKMQRGAWAVVVGVVMASWSAPAAAQDSNSDPLVISSYTANLTTTSWQFIAIAAPISSSTTGALAQVMVNGQASTELLRENAVALRQDITVGDGPLLRDVATMIGMADEAGRVGAILRGERVALLRALGALERGETDATPLLTLALAALAKDPELSARARQVVIVW
jgi:hypothetical protein